MEQRGPVAHEFSDEMRGRGEMIKAPIDLQDLSQRIYIKGKAEYPGALASGFRSAEVE